MDKAETSYYVDNVDDQVVETNADLVVGGLDRVIAGIDYTLGDNVENLLLIGSSALNGTGNSLANTIVGNAEANVLYGDNGDDRLDGRGGADLLVGGQGADSYYVDNVDDQVVETNADLVNGGLDEVVATIDYTLGANVENMFLIGSSAINGTGNSLANTIVGNSEANVITGGDGADRLFGGLGSDTLIGGAGADRFVFNTAPGSANVDRIADLSVIDDSIQLENSIFTSLGLVTGRLAASAFASGDHAVTSDQYVVYDNVTGALYYDADGSGVIAQVQIAALDPDLTSDGLSHLDFQVI